MSFSDRSFMKFFYIVIGALVFLAVMALVLANLLGGASREDAQYFRDLKDDTLLATAGDTIQFDDVVVAAASADAGSSAGAEKSGEEVYTTACSACHMTGAAGAPKLEAAAWEARVAQGFDTLATHAINGFNAMPAKGGNMALSDTEVQKAIAYMISQAGYESEAPAEFLPGAAAETESEAAVESTETAEVAKESSDSASESTESVELAGATEAAHSEEAHAEESHAVEKVESNDVAHQTEATDSSSEMTQEAEVAVSPTEEASESETPAAESSDSPLLAADLSIGEATYNKACMACHMTGAAGAPKLEAAAWEARVAQGHETLVNHALNGFNAMPAKGGNPTLSDDEVIAAVAFMVNTTGLLK